MRGLLRLCCTGQQAARSQAPQPQGLCGIARGAALVQPRLCDVHVAQPMRPTGITKIAGAVAAAQQVDQQHVKSRCGEPARRCCDGGAGAVHFLAERGHVKQRTATWGLRGMKHAKAAAWRRIEEERAGIAHVQASGAANDD